MLEVFLRSDRAAVILEMLDEKGNDVKLSKRSRGIFERPDCNELVYKGMLADVTLVDPSSWFARRHRKLLRFPHNTLSRAHEACQAEKVVPDKR